MSQRPYGRTSTHHNSIIYYSSGRGFIAELFITYNYVKDIATFELHICVERWMLIILA